MSDITNGVTFGDKHSYDDWGIYLRARPVISPPEPKTVYVDIPGADGSIDLTESLTGTVVYNDRLIKCEFTVIDARTKWANIYSEILDYLHGQKMKVLLDEDPSYYYEGRMKVNEWTSDKFKSFIVIEGTVYPYKYERFSSLEAWEWDSFNFETGVIRDYSSLEVDGSLTVTVIGSRMPVVLTVIVSDVDSEISVTYDGSIYTLEEGTNVVPGIEIGDGEYELTFSGIGTVSIDYRGGRL